MNIEIKASNLGKRFNYDILFQNISFDFHTPNTYGILGPNGCGKSTLLKMLIAYSPSSSGELLWKSDGQVIAPELYRDYFSFAAPYVEIIEEFSIQEFFTLLLRRWPDYYSSYRFGEISDAFGLSTLQELPISKLSSGQKQKVRLAQVLASEKPVWILDEPSSFLDSNSIDAYRAILKNQKDKLIVIASNTAVDFIDSTQFYSLA